MGKRLYALSNKRIMKKIYLILIILSIILQSCGARKVDKTIIENETKVEQVVEQKDSITKEVFEELKYDVESCEYELEPIDTTKEIVFNGVKIKNARVKIKKTKDNSLYSKKEIASKTSLKQSKTAVSDKNKVFVKNTEKKSSEFYWWIILVLLILVLIAYRKQIRLIFTGI